MRMNKSKEYSGRYWSRCSWCKRIATHQTTIRSVSPPSFFCEEHAKEAAVEFMTPTKELPEYTRWKKANQPDIQASKEEGSLFDE